MQVKPKIVCCPVLSNFILGDQVLNQICPESIRGKSNLVEQR